MKNTSEIKIFLDCDILLDILLKRKEFFAQTIQILDSCETTDYLTACTSPLAVANIHSIYSKALKNKNRSLEFVGELIKNMEIIDLKGEAVQSALGNRQMKDFEDSLQMEAAIHYGADYLVTRNIKDYPETELISIQDPLNMNFILKGIKTIKQP